MVFPQAIDGDGAVSRLLWPDQPLGERQPPAVFFAPARAASP